MNEFNQTVLGMISDNSTLGNLQTARDDIDLEAMRDLLRSDPLKKPRSKRPWQSWTLKEADNEADLRKIEEAGNLVGKSFVDNVMHGGLPSQLSVAIGSRVMLRRNISITARLVNGATGTIKNFKFSGTGEVETINIEFDGNNVLLRSIFAEGQFYVGVSRVTTLEWQKEEQKKKNAEEEAI